MTIKQLAMDVKLFRTATVGDCYQMAQLFSIASDGVTCRHAPRIDSLHRRYFIDDCSRVSDGVGKEGRLMSPQNVKKTKWEIYKELELIPDSVPQPGAGPLRVAAWLWSLWQSLATAMTRDCEPQIRQSLDPSGQLWWDAYDPITGKTTYLESEDEVYRWLDQLPYR